MAEKIGSLLVRKKLITPAQLDEALKLQVIYGGRLGTNLVELGYVDIESLAQALSEQRGFPVATLAELEATTQGTLDMLPKALAEKNLAYPLRADGRKLVVAMASPFDFAMVDDLSFSTGFRIIPKICPEIRVLYYLEKHYGIERKTRYIRLADEPLGGPRSSGPGAGASSSKVDRRSLLQGAASTDATTMAPGGRFAPLAAGQFLSADEDAFGGGQPAAAPAPVMPGMPAMPAPAPAAPINPASAARRAALGLGNTPPAGMPPHQQMGYPAAQTPTGYPAQPGMPPYPAQPQMPAYGAAPQMPQYPGQAGSPGYPAMPAYPAHTPVPGYPSALPGFAAQQPMPGYPAQPAMPGYPTPQPMPTGAAIPGFAAQQPMPGQPAAYPAQAPHPQGMPPFAAAHTPVPQAAPQAPSSASAARRAALGRAMPPAAAPSLTPVPPAFDLPGAPVAQPAAAPTHGANAASAARRAALLGGQHPAPQQVPTLTPVPRKAPGFGPSAHEAPAAPPVLGAPAAAPGFAAHGTPSAFRHTAPGNEGADLGGPPVLKGGANPKPALSLGIQPPKPFVAPPVSAVVRPAAPAEAPPPRPQVAAPPEEEIPLLDTDAVSVELSAELIEETPEPAPAATAPVTPSPLEPAAPVPVELSPIEPPAPMSVDLSPIEPLAPLPVDLSPIEPPAPASTPQLEPPSIAVELPAAPVGPTVQAAPEIVAVPAEQPAPIEPPQVEPLELSSPTLIEPLGGAADSLASMSWSMSFDMPTTPLPEIPAPAPAAQGAFAPVPPAAPLPPEAVAAPSPLELVAPAVPAQAAAPAAPAAQPVLPATAPMAEPDGKPALWEPPTASEAPIAAEPAVANAPPPLEPQSAIAEAPASHPVDMGAQLSQIPGAPAATTLADARPVASSPIEAPAVAPDSGTTLEATPQPPFPASVPAAQPIEPPAAAPAPTEAAAEPGLASPAELLAAAMAAGYIPEPGLEPPAPAPREAPPAPIEVFSLLDMPEPPMDGPADPQPEYRPLSGMMLVEEMLGRATDREKIAEAVLWFAEGRFSTAMLFSVHGDHANGWRGQGPSLDAERLARMTLPLDQPSLLKAATESENGVVWLAPQSGIDRRLLAFAGHCARSAAAAIAIRARGQVVDVLYGTCGSWPLREATQSDLERIAWTASRAYDRLLLVHKSVDE